MKRRVVFAPEAQDDLLSLYTYIANQSGPSTAIGYINRIERYCLGSSSTAFSTPAETSTESCATADREARRPKSRRAFRKRFC